MFHFLMALLDTNISGEEFISKITIKGGDLKTPIEITDLKTLANVDVWSGPGTGWTGGAPKQAKNFVIDWSQGVAEHPKGLRRYEVCFYKDAE